VISSNGKIDLTEYITVVLKEWRGLIFTLDVLNQRDVFKPPGEKCTRLFKPDFQVSDQ